MNMSTKPIIAAAAAGAIAGAVVVGAASYLSTNKKTAEGSDQWIPITAEEKPASNPVPGLGVEDRARMAKLERRLDTVAESVSRSRTAFAETAVDDSESTDEEATADAFDIEQARAYEIESWEQKKVAFESEPIDRGWAFGASNAFLSDLSAIDEGHSLAVIDAECRTSQCKVVVEWPSYDDAVAGFSQLLHQQYQVNCAKETLLPEPSESEMGLPYQMTVLFDCSGARGRG